MTQQEGKTVRDDSLSYAEVVRTYTSFEELSHLKKQRPIEKSLCRLAEGVIAE